MKRQTRQEKSTENKIMEALGDGDACVVFYSDGGMSLIVPASDPESVVSEAVLCATVASLINHSDFSDLRDQVLERMEEMKVVTSEDETVQ